MTLPDDPRDAISRLADSAENIEGVVGERFKVSKSALRRAFWTSLLALLVGIAGIGVGVWGRLDAHRAGVKARDAAASLAAYKRSTVEARIGSCQQANFQERRQAQAERDEERARQAETSVAVTRLLALLHISPAELRALQAAHLRRYDATVTRAHPLRDCSPAGIAKYLEGVTPSTTAR